MDKQVLAPYFKKIHNVFINGIHDCFRSRSCCFLLEDNDNLLGIHKSDKVPMSRPKIIIVKPNRDDLR